MENPRRSFKAVARFRWLIALLCFPRPKYALPTYRKAQLEELIQKESAREGERKRKVDTRRKILLGAVFMRWMQGDDKLRRRVRRHLARHLTREIDREVFDLPELGVDDQAARPTRRQ